MAEFFETQLKSEALTASRRKLVFRGRNGKRYTYSKYRNTGQLASNIKISSNGKGKKVSDGTRANYSAKAIMVCISWSQKKVHEQSRRY
jgi:hypothetical protein